jgi:hypothetical protein
MDNKRLVDKLLEASNKIFKPRRGSGNYIIINSVYRRFIRMVKIKKIFTRKT